jgi:hypothetical protein
MKLDELVQTKEEYITTSNKTKNILIEGILSGKYETLKLQVKGHTLNTLNFYNDLHTKGENIKDIEFINSGVLNQSLIERYKEIYASMSYNDVLRMILGDDFPLLEALDEFERSKSNKISPNEEFKEEDVNEDPVGLNLNSVSKGDEGDSKGDEGDREGDEGDGEGDEGDGEGDEGDKEPVELNLNNVGEGVELNLNNVSPNKLNNVGEGDELNLNNVSPNKLNNVGEGVELNLNNVSPNKLNNVGEGVELNLNNVSPNKLNNVSPNGFNKISFKKKNLQPKKL